MKYNLIPIALMISSFFISVAQADTILGIHARKWHAWISVTVNGTTTFYGVWKDGNRRVGHNGGGKNDLRINVETFDEAASSRYDRLTSNQVNQLNALLNQNAKWGVWKNCAWWASRIVRKVVGEDVDANKWLGIPDPEEVCNNINDLEAKNPTSHLMPDVSRSNKSCSSGSGSSSSSSSW